MISRVGNGPVILPLVVQPTQAKINHQVALTGATANYVGQERVVREDNKSSMFSQAVAQRTHYILQEARRVTQKKRKTPDQQAFQHFRRRVNRLEGDPEQQDQQEELEQWFLGDILEG